MRFYEPQNGEVLSPTKGATCICVATKASEFFLGPLMAARGLVYEIHAFEKVTLKLVQPEDKLVVNGKEADCACIEGATRVFCFADHYCVVTDQGAKDGPAGPSGGKDAKPAVVKKKRATKAKATDPKE